MKLKSKVVQFHNLKLPRDITTHSWRNSYSTSISVCGVWGVRVGVQVSKKEFHIHIHLDYDRVEFLSCIKKEKKKKELPRDM